MAESEYRPEVDAATFIQTGAPEVIGSVIGVVLAVADLAEVAICTGAGHLKWPGGEIEGSGYNSLIA